jgi:NAD(P)-dependent dehydrogenase (short-subunit alcohol dehydrogenase family)
MAESHHDKVAVISGAARGIGQAFAQRLAREGAYIVIADVLPATDTAKLVQEAGRDVLASKCDVSSESSVTELASEVTARFGRCDILINCAGIYPRQPFAEMTFADWRRMQAINLDSVFLMCAAFGPGMRARKWGRIVNMASATLGTVVSGFVHYVASKGGVVGFTRLWRRNSEMMALQSMRSHLASPDLRAPLHASHARAWPAWKTSSRLSPRCRPLSDPRCRAIWSARSPFLPATMPPS